MAAVISGSSEISGGIWFNTFLGLPIKQMNKLYDCGSNNLLFPLILLRIKYNNNYCQASLMLIGAEKVLMQTISH